MKKIIYWIGIIFLSIIVILNMVFTARFDDGEHVAINNNGVVYAIALIFTAIAIFFITKYINKVLYKDEDSKKLKRLRIILFIVAFIIYISFCVVWTVIINPPIVGDQIHAANLAQTFHNGNLEQFLPNLTYAGIPLSEYMQCYHQQISLAFIFSLFFDIVYFDLIYLLRILNIIGNALVVIAIYKIGKHLSKKYKMNNVLLLTLILTFISLPMLSTFIYGDIPSLGLCLMSVYFMMKYTETKKIVYPIFASIFTMIAYMMRMNSLIFIIATVMYLLFNLFNGIFDKTWKERLVNIAIIALYIIVSIIPSVIVKNYYLDKYNMDKNKAYPNVSYLLMAMEEGPRANGWYNESIGEAALRNPIDIKEEYINRIKERIKYFSQNIGYAFNFYTMKQASMWTENTYSAVYNNKVDRYNLESITNPLTFYQKTLLILSCVCSIIVLIQNRKNISIDLIFLITIFIGGFAFHILWEAKSRYIIPYIVVLIPIAGIQINKFKLKKS